MRSRNRRRLLVAGDVEPELEDHGTVARQVLLVVPNRLEALAPDGFRVDGIREPLSLENARVNPHHEDFFVVAAIEDAYAAALREADGAPPQEVVVDLEGRRPLEREHLDARRVDAPHDRPNRPVLARRVHGLEHQENGIPILRGEHALQLIQLFDPVLQGLLRRLARWTGARRRGGEGRYLERAVERDEVGTGHGLEHDAHLYAEVGSR